jgi:hypothetical protein
VASFRSYVPEKQRATFDEAWRDYRCSTKRDVDTQDYTHYMNFGSESINSLGGITRLKQDGKANFKRNVDRLLSFAQDTLTQHDPFHWENVLGTRHTTYRR